VHPTPTRTGRPPCFLDRHAEYSKPASLFSPILFVRTSLWSAGRYHRLDEGLVKPMRVWIDQDLCTGDGLCTDHAPEVFTILEDGIAYVVEQGEVLNDPGGARSLAVVPGLLEATVLQSSEVCPGECIFVELDEGDQLP